MKNIIPFLKKSNPIFKWQDKNKIVVWIFIKIEKSLVTKNYSLDSDEYIEQPICRFNKDSDMWKVVSFLYDVNFKDIKEFI